MIDKLERKNKILQSSFINNIIEHEDRVCSGCDKHSETLTYAKNDLPYCPRCYEEIKAMYKKD